MHLHITHYCVLSFTLDITDLVITWDSTSYEVGEGDGTTQSVCATSAGLLQSNLMLDIAVLTSDDTATGIHIRTSNYVQVNVKFVEYRDGKKIKGDKIGMHCTHNTVT